MAWPFDARNVDYAAGAPVQSANLNEIQDRIVQVFEEKTIHILDPMSMDSDWRFNGDYWAAYEAGSIYFALRLHGPSSAILSSKIKSFWVFGSYPGDYALHRHDGSYDDAATAPALGVALDSGSLGGAYDTWIVKSVPIPAQISAGERQIVLKITATQPGVHIGGWQVVIKPIKDS